MLKMQQVSKFNIKSKVNGNLKLSKQKQHLLNLLKILKKVSILFELELLELLKADMFTVIGQKSNL